MLLKIEFTNDDAKNTYKNGELLNYSTTGSSGFDIRAISILLPKNGNEINLVNEDFILKSGMRCLVKVGLKTQIETGYEIQIRPRSGLALKNGITIVNTPGTIDSDYRGEIGAILLNTSDEDFTIKYGDRIAQAIICQITKVDFEFGLIDETQRGSGGFGSTGKN